MNASTHPPVLAWLLLLAAAAVPAVQAADPPSAAEQARAAGLLPPPDPSALADQTIVTSASFLSDHPDLRWRLQGLNAYRRGRYPSALAYFRRAARYADKPAQAMVGEMYWKGQAGGAIDRPLGYAWMDLAAERGYPTLALVRERYWLEMTEVERQRALRLGKELYDEYGDEVAKPRLEAVLVKARRNITGSRVGFVGVLSIQIPTPSGTRTVDGHQFYQDKFWKPELYWRWQDRDWRKAPAGRVDVGTLQTAPAAAAPADEDEDNGD